MTKREVITMVLENPAFATSEDFVAYAKNELALLDKKAKSRAKSATQIENDAIKEKILATLTVDLGVTVTELQKMNSELAVYSNQRISALLRQLILEGKADKYKDGKFTKFVLATE